MALSYATQGTCSKEIYIDVQDGIVKEVKFTGGCSGNLKALGILVKGMSVEEVIQKLRGITCGDKTTSCADQLTKALEQQLGDRRPALGRQER